MPQKGGEGAIVCDRKPQVLASVFVMLLPPPPKERKKNAPLHVPAPKMALPGHAESYNPPEEYLPDEEEIKEWCVMHDLRFVWVDAVLRLLYSSVECHAQSWVSQKTGAIFYASCCVEDPWPACRVY